jgi:hypothetical protein
MQCQQDVGVSKICTICSSLPGLHLSIYGGLPLQTFGAFMGLLLQLRMVKRPGVSEELLGAGVQNLYNS